MGGVDHGQEALLTPAVTQYDGIQPLLCHAQSALDDEEVLLCGRGTIAEAAFDVINDDGEVLTSGLPRDRDSRRAVSSQAPLPAATTTAIPAATPARVPQCGPETIPQFCLVRGMVPPREHDDSQPQHKARPSACTQPPLAQMLPQAWPLPPSAACHQHMEQFPPDVDPPRIKSPPPEFRQPHVQPLPLPVASYLVRPQVKQPPRIPSMPFKSPPPGGLDLPQRKAPPPRVDLPQRKPPPPNVGQPQGEMQQRAEQQQTGMDHRMMLNEATARCRQYKMEYDEVRMEAEIFRCKMLLLEKNKRWPRSGKHTRGWRNRRISGLR